MEPKALSDSDYGQAFMGLPDLIAKTRSCAALDKSQRRLLLPMECLTPPVLECLYRLSSILKLSPEARFRAVHLLDRLLSEQVKECDLCCGKTLDGESSTVISKKAFTCILVCVGISHKVTSQVQTDYLKILSSKKVDLLDPSEDIHEKLNFIRKCELSALRLLNFKILDPSLMVYTETLRALLKLEEHGQCFLNLTIALLDLVYCNWIKLFQALYSQLFPALPWNRELRIEKYTIEGNKFFIGASVVIVSYSKLKSLSLSSREIDSLSNRIVNLVYHIINKQEVLTFAEVILNFC